MLRWRHHWIELHGGCCLQTVEQLMGLFYAPDPSVFPVTLESHNNFRLLLDLMLCRWDLVFTITNFNESFNILQQFCILILIFFYIQLNYFDRNPPFVDKPESFDSPSNHIAAGRLCPWPSVSVKSNPSIFVPLWSFPPVKIFLHCQLNDPD